MLSVVLWDLTSNDCFVHYSSVFCECKGVPIGGSTSAQYASIVLMYLERGVSWDAFPLCMRYRDNYFFFTWTDRAPKCVVTLEQIRRPLLSLCKMRLVCLYKLRGGVSPRFFLERTLGFTNMFPAVVLKAPLAFAQLGSPTPP